MFACNELGYNCIKSKKELRKILGFDNKLKIISAKILSFILDFVMHRTKLIHVITSIDRGGAENQLIELIDQQKKYDIVVFPLIGKNYWEKYLKKEKLKYQNLSTMFIFQIF